VKDDWGTGETHGGGITEAVPVYSIAKVGATFKYNLMGGDDAALLSQNRFLRLKGDGSSITIQTTSNDDVDLYVHLRGVEVASSASQSGNESVSFTAKSGEEYVVNVQGFGTTPGPYDVTVEFLP